MKTAKLLTIAASFTLGLAMTGVNTAYGSDDSQNNEIDDTDRVVEIDGEDAAGSEDLLEVETSDVRLPSARHGQRLTIPAKVFKPKLAKTAGRAPAVLMMHGSGGLTKMPGKKQQLSQDPCSPELEDQYERWGEELAQRGYVVLMPSSYSARGFCDMHVDKERIPNTFDERPEAILSRLYDMDVAARYLCEMDEVDCDRMGVMGFSHGATMAMLALHWQMDHALDYYRKHSPDRDEIDFEMRDLSGQRPRFKVGIAYYPGCGTDGFLPRETDDGADIHNKYFPSADLYVLHASRDELAKICTVDSSVKNATGEREIQSAQVAAERGVDDTYHIEVYPEAGHGFDSDEKEINEPGNPSAAAHARKLALQQLYTHLN